MNVLWWSAFCQLLQIWMVQVSGSSRQGIRWNVTDFNISQLLGEWYDIGRTTYVTGRDLLSSQQWNFVQGQDGTVVALFNGWCKAHVGCTDTKVFRVKLNGNNTGEFTLEGNGETLLLCVESNLQTELIVSICFNWEARSDCPQTRLQVSVLSRYREFSNTNTRRWLEIERHLPVSMESIDSSSGGKCPDLFIDDKFVTSDLMKDEDTILENIVGFPDNTSYVYLPCSLGNHADNVTKNNNSRVIWVREKNSTVITVNNRVVINTEDGAIQFPTQTPGTFGLLLSGISDSAGEGVYGCFLERGDERVLLNRVVVSSGDFEAHPVIVYHSSNMSARKGDSAIMECYVNSYPSSQVKWWKKLDDIPALHPTGYTGIRNVIANVQSEDAGVYVCVADNDKAPVASAVIDFRVGLLPEVKIKENTLSARYDGELTLICDVSIHMMDKLAWQKDGVDIKNNVRHVIIVTQISAEHYRLTLRIQHVLRKDFGPYTCVAKDHQFGESSSQVMVTEELPTGEHCKVKNIPVMENFNNLKFYGDMEMIQTTHFMAEDNVFEFDSMVQGIFTDLTGGLVRYHRGFSRAEQRCLDPVVISLVGLDTPGDYILSYNGYRGRYKIVYTDYTHTVVYFCLISDHEKECPRNQTTVQILSRFGGISYKQLFTLYKQVISACVPVSSLDDAVPGMCSIPEKFMESGGYLGLYREFDCRVAHLPVQGDMTPNNLAGMWHLVGEVRPQNYTVAPMESLHVVPTTGGLVAFYRGFRSRLCSLCETPESGLCSVCEIPGQGLCSATEATVLHKSWAVSEYFVEVKGHTVETKILYADSTSLAMYTCLVWKLDGFCEEESQMVHLYHRTRHIDYHSKLWLIRSASQACVDIDKLKWIQPSGNCSVPASLMTTGAAELVAGDHFSIGCHLKLIPIAQGFDEDKFTGRWLVFHRNLGSLAKFSKNLTQFSQSYQVVKRPGGKLLLLIRYFESQWDNCSPTKSMEMKQKSKPGDYIFTPQSGTVLLKVLSLSEDAAVVYWCHKMTSQGFCHPDYLIVEILVRTPSTKISKDRLKEMLQISWEVCASMEDFQPTSQIEKCPIPENITRLAEMGNITAAFDVPVFCEDQLIKGAADLDVEKLKGAWTVMWSNDFYWGHDAPCDESAFIILTPDGLTYLWREYNNDLHRCKPTKAGKFLRTSGPGNYFSGLNGNYISLTILWTDYSTMFVVGCDIDGNSICHRNHTFAEILTRGAAVDDDRRLALLVSLNLTCLNSFNWFPTRNPGICKVGSSVLNAAYEDGFSSEYIKIGCHVDVIGSQATLTDDMIIGSWRTVYQTKLYSSDTPAASTSFHFTQLADGSISLLFRPYSVDKEECLPAQMVQLSRDEGRDGTVFKLINCNSPIPYGYIYMAYGDGNRLVLVFCRMNKDSLCDPETTALFLLHREGTSMTLNQTLVDIVTGLGIAACVDHPSLVQATLDPCPIDHAVVTDVATEVLQSCASDGLVQCYPGYIPVHIGFNFRELSGRWYTIRDSKGGFWSDEVPVGAATYHFLSKGNDTVVMMYSTVGTEDQCQPVQMRLLDPTEQAGVFVFRFKDSQALMKVVWMNNKHDFAVVYWCFDVREDVPWCGRKAHVSILSRYQRLGNKTLNLGLKIMAAEACVSAKDLIQPTSEPCEIPSNIVSAVQGGGIKVSSTFSPIQCAQKFIQAVADFNMTQFKGVWHTVSQTKWRREVDPTDSLIHNFAVSKNGMFVRAYTSYHISEDFCLPMEVVVLNMTDSTGQWIYKEGNTTVMAKVVWTDYNTSALLYTCWGPVKEQGFCERTDMQVEFLSRSLSLAPEAENALRAALPSVCVHWKEMTKVNTGLCAITKELQALVGEEFKPNKEALTFCRVMDTPMEENFTFSQMAGVWYEIARTRFTINSMESGISVLTEDQDTGDMNGLFTGTLNEQCQSPMKIIKWRRFRNGPHSAFEVRLLGEGNILPSSTHRVLFFDGEYMMYIVCYEEDEYGLCPLKKLEVTLMGRSRHLSPHVEEKLETILTSVCLSREDLVLTREVADCLPNLMTAAKATELPDTSACQLTKIPVVENLNVDDLLGKWYSVGRVDYKTKSQHISFVISISRSQSSTLQWRQWNFRDEGCETQKTIHMKAACEGSTNGDYLSTHASSYMLQWTSLKIMNVTKDLLLVYTCVEETGAGFCRPTGIQLDLLTRSKSATLHDFLLPAALEDVCLKPQYTKAVESSDACDHLAAVAAPIFEKSTCDWDSMPALSVSAEQMSGLWYMAGASVDKIFPSKDMIVAYRPKANNGLDMSLIILDPNGRCKGPLQVEMKQRCPDNPGPDYMNRFKSPGIWSWALWKMMYVDNSSLTTVNCIDQQPDGSCSAQGIKVYFLTREPNPSQAQWTQMYQKFLYQSTSCFHHLQVQNVLHEGTCDHLMKYLPDDPE